MFIIINLCKMTSRRVGGLMLLLSIAKPKLDGGRVEGKTYLVFFREAAKRKQSQREEETVIRIPNDLIDARLFRVRYLFTGSMQAHCFFFSVLFTK